jgi:DNA adenine methylase
MQRDGVIAPGAGLVKGREAGRGLKSHWYPETLTKRFMALQAPRSRVSFEQADAFDVIRRYADDPDAVFFIDPPYTAPAARGPASASMFITTSITRPCSPSSPV